MKMLTKLFIFTSNECKINWKKITVNNFRQKMDLTALLKKNLHTWNIGRWNSKVHFSHRGGSEYNQGFFLHHLRWWPLKGKGLSFLYMSLCASIPLTDCVQRKCPSGGSPVLSAWESMFLLGFVHCVSGLLCLCGLSLPPALLSSVSSVSVNRKQKK